MTKNQQLIFTILFARYLKYVVFGVFVYKAYFCDQVNHVYERIRKSYEFTRDNNM